MATNPPQHYGPTLAIPNPPTSSTSSPTSKPGTPFHTPLSALAPHHSNPSRPPAPSLFVGPPSQNASTNSLLQHPSPSSNRLPFLRQRTFNNDLTPSATNTSNGANASASAGASKQHESNSNININTNANINTSQNQGPTTEAIWAEMQNTLEEVELNGMSGANVFGAEHARALEELRAAQVELARAWARSEGEGDEGEDRLDGLGTDGDGDGEGDEVGEGALGLGFDSATGKSAKGSVGAAAASVSAGSAAGKGKSVGDGLGSGKTQLEEETENDIMLARKRRLANDKYFERVSKGVQDVVARLAVVADKMGGVEMESASIWGDKESVLDSRGGG